MTTSRTTTSNQADQEAVSVRMSMSSRAGRLLFALLLSPGLSSLELSTLAGIPRKLLPACIDELIRIQEQPLDPEATEVVQPLETPVPAGASDSVITHNGAQKRSTTYLAEPDPEDAIAEVCRAADQLGDIKAQALAVVDAWRFFFPKLANHEEITKKQDLSPRKARQWVEEVSKAFAGQEATTVYGWLRGVDEGKLLSMQFPLAWVNKMVVNKTKEAKEQEPTGEGEEKFMDAWRNYAQKLIDQGVNRHGNQDSETSLNRIAQAVRGGTGQPS